VVGPETASRILESLSGVELILTVVVAATGIRISEALGLKWEDTVNASMVAAQDAVMKAIQTGSRAVN
jgi:integrase